jgi:SM-20-related protein
MPSAEFFRQTGLFVVPGFLEPKLVAVLCQLMEAAPTEKATVVKAGGADRLDENIRKVEAAVLPKDIRAPLKQRLLGLVPDLERHFRVALSGCESPHYLVYRPGGFFKPHSDGGYRGANSPEHHQRRVSAVIFLNCESEEPADGTYGQGRLTFYGLLEGPQWERCGFALSPDPGLLIAFPSDKVHEVTPVSHGKRFTVVTWFYTPDGEPKYETAEPVAMTRAIQSA